MKMLAKGAAKGIAKLRAQTMSGWMPLRPIVLMNIKSLLLVVSRVRIVCKLLRYTQGTT